MLPTRFPVNRPFGSGEEEKNRFPRWPPKLPTQVLVSWPFGSGEKVKNRFSSWAPSWISYRKDFTFFDVQVTPMLPTKFRVSWPVGSGEEAKNRFSSWPPWWPSWISDWNDFSYFWSTNYPYDFLPSFKSCGLSVQEKKGKNRFSRWPPWRSSWISDRNNFNYIRSTGHPDASYQVSHQLAFRFRWRSQKIEFQVGRQCGHLRFPIGMMFAIFDLQVTPMLPTKFRFRRRSEKKTFKMAAMAAILDFRPERF